MAKTTSFLDNLVSYSLSSRLPLAVFFFSVVAGLIALQFTPREEEPQIVVPMIDVVVDAQGLTARQVERQVTIPLEKLLTQIPGVENIYSSSLSGHATVTLRFFVGEDREESLLNTYNKLFSNQRTIPAVVDNWSIQPVEVDDVPIIMLGLWSDSPEQYSDYDLRRIADEVSHFFQAVSDTSEVNVSGGRTRTIHIYPKPESLAARQSTTADIIRALEVSNTLQVAGFLSLNHESFVLESGDVLRLTKELSTLVVNVIDGTPVFLSDVANIVDGPSEPTHYSWIDFSAQHPAYNKSQEQLPMVTISIAKQRGSNAVKVAKDTHELIAKLQKNILPKQVHLEILRDYGKTANEKVDNLGSSLLFAVFTVVIFISVFLGWRPAIIVGLAVPISYGITLMFDMAFGYTINRVTLFALILSLGLLVDDPITGIDNIERFLKKKHGTTKEKIAAAISELKIPLVMSTITIILAFIPLAFITGMMGPYMAPMAFNVPISVAASTVVAFIVTPWLASKILKPEPANATNDKEGRFKRFYTHFLDTILSNRRYAKFTLFIVLILFIGTALLPMFRLVPLKLLPFDNKNEIQVIIDMPESSTLEQTASKAKQVSNIIKEFNEVLSVASFVAEPSPIDFNGMVRRYYQRNTPYFADLRIILVDKDLRQHQSHGIVLRLRKKLAALNTDLVKIKVVEVPPGPPVLSTLVAEVYGNSITPYSRLQDAASLVEARLAKEAHIVEIDSTVEDDQYRYRFIVDKTKAALSGVSTQEVNDLIALANHGYTAGFLQLESEAKPLPIELRLPYAEISSLNDILRLQIRGQHGIAKTASSLGVDSSPQPLVALGEIGTFEKSLADKSFQRKDLKPVVYVTAELSGRTPAEVIADIHADLNNENIKATHWQDRNYFSMGGGDSWTLPDDISVKWTGEGEWEITVKVFRDMGLAFMFALVGIFFVLKLQTKSTALSLIIMSAIPLTIIGIMPGFWLLNQFGEREIAQAPEPVLFTATAMIGMIALAGIVVRNSLILVEFITQSLEQGLPLKHALIEAGSVRMRPVLLTAGTTLLGNLIITLDPVFSGLAIAIIFGIISSTIFTLLVIPIVYLLVFDKPSKA